jgi:hypothetical protein
MKILVCCEESQAVTKELRKLGHEAYSCDIIDCSGGHSEWHIKQDVLPLLNGNCSFSTRDGANHVIYGKWDMLIAFPPCTYLTVTGNRWFNEEVYGEKARQRKKNREEAVEFFMCFANSDCDKIIIENPVGVMSTLWRKPDQIIHPYMFGDAFEKKTCLWLKGVNPLVATNIVTPPERVVYKSGKTMAKWYTEVAGLPREERAKIRSKTFMGVANAIATQCTI